MYVCDSGVPILYHESKSILWVLSIPWIYIYTISFCKYHESLPKPRAHVNTIGPCLYHESMPIPWVLVNSMNQCPYLESFPIIGVNVYTMSPETQITEIIKLHNTKFSNTKIETKGIHKKKLQKHWNASSRNTEIQMTNIQ